MNKLEEIENLIEFYKWLRQKTPLDFIYKSYTEIIGDLIAQYNELIYAENILQLCLTGE